MDLSSIMQFYQTFATAAVVIGGIIFFVEAFVILKRVRG
jgi:hypothetical protein